MPQMFTVDNIAKRLWGFLKCFASNETAQVKYEWEAMFGAEGQVKDSRWNQSMRLCCVSTSSWMCCIWMWCTYTCLSVAIDKKYIKIHKNTTFNICSLNGPGWRIQKLEINSCWTRLPGKDALAAADLESNDVFGMCGPQLWLFGTAMSLDESRFLVNEKGPKWCAPHEVKWTITWLRL